MPATARRIVPADRTEEIRYAVRDIVVLAQQVAASGRKMLYLNVGDPNPYDFAPPAHMVEAVTKAMRDNQNGYAPSSGIPEATEAIRAEADRCGIQDVQHVYVTSGASEAIELAMAALANAGSNVLTPSPGYPLYTAVLAKLGVENRPYYLDEDNDWAPDADDIAARIDDKTCAIVLINPNNPTGAQYSTETLQKIVKLAIDKNLVIFSDEIYDKLIFDGRKHVATASLAREAKVVTFNGLSKSYVVPGWRVGWGIVSGPSEEIEDYCEAIRKMERARLCANHPEQYAIKPALEGSQDHLIEMMQRLTVRRDITVDRLNAIDGISCVKPGGAFYAFPKVEGDIDDNVFVKKVIEETGVVVVPGSGFGQKEGTAHFRVVFLPDEQTLEDSYAGIARVRASFS